MDFSHLNSLIVFFIISVGFGYTVLWLSKAKLHTHPFVRFLEIFSVGFATFAFLGVALELLHIPLHIGVYLGLAFIGPAVSLVNNIMKKRGDNVFGGTEPFKKLLKSEATWCGIILLVMLGAFFMFYHAGATGYPYFEDDDPWAHAQSSMYIATQHTYSVDPEVRALNPGYAHYLEPYPPTYDVLMGVLRQTNDSIMWTLKFFNVLFITIGLGFFFLLFREYLQSDLKALFATMILAVLPSFMSHFIWSQTLAIILMPIGMYTVLRAMHETSWRAPAIVAIAAALVTQPMVALVFGISVLLLFAFVALHEAITDSASSSRADASRADTARADTPKTDSIKRKTKDGSDKEVNTAGVNKRESSRTGSNNATSNKTGLNKSASFKNRFKKSINIFIVGFCGIILSLVFWGAQLFKWGLSGIMGSKGGEFAAAVGGYTVQAYTLGELIFPPSSSRIDQAIGWGLGVAILLVISIIVIIVTAKKALNAKRDWTVLHALAWFLFTGYLVFAPSIGLPAIWTSRSWPLVAVPLAIIITIGAFAIINSLTKNWMARAGIALLFAVLIVATSLPAKVAVQSAQWPPGVSWTALPELQGYVEMQNTLAKGSRVYPLCGNDMRSLGFDMMSEPWDLANAKFRQRGLNFDVDELSIFLSTQRYQYVTMDATCVRDYGENRTVALANDMTASGHYRQVFSKPGILVVEFI